MPSFPQQLISTQQLSKVDIQTLIENTREMEAALEKKQELQTMRNKIMAALFYEPSTRTRLSFETAFLRLGGQVINATKIGSSSLKKGETIQDTLRVIENYADVIVMRHPKKGAAKQATEGTQKAFVNAGDGIGEHPSQALIDLYTIQKRHGKLNGLNIAFIGDLKYGRTVHSLVYLLANYELSFTFIAPEELSMPKKIKDDLKEKGISFAETTKMESVFGELDVLYVTRVQEERFEDKSQYDRLKDKYIIDANLVKKGKKELSVLHPLPRIHEIKTDVDALPNAAYFEQVSNSIPVRMAILNLVYAFA